MLEDRTCLVNGTRFFQSLRFVKVAEPSAWLMVICYEVKRYAYMNSLRLWKGKRCRDAYKPKCGPLLKLITKKAKSTASIHELSYDFG